MTSTSFLQLNVVENLLGGPDIDALCRTNIIKSGRESAPASSFNAEQPSSCGSTDILHDERYIPGKAVPFTSEASHSSEVIAGALGLDTDMMTTHNESTGKRKVVKYTDKVAHDRTIVPDDFQGSSKKQKSLDALHLVSGTSVPVLVQDHITDSERRNPDADLLNKNELEMTNNESAGHTSRELVCFGSSSCDESMDNVKDEPKDVTAVLKQPSKSTGGQVKGLCSSSSEWKAVEKELYMKGLEIFGRNRYAFLNLKCVTWIMDFTLPCSFLLF